MSIIDFFSFHLKPMISNLSPLFPSPLLHHIAHFWEGRRRSNRKTFHLKFVKFVWLQLRRYKVYVSILNAKILADQQQQLEQQQQQQLAAATSSSSNQLTTVAAAEETADKLPKRYQSQTATAVGVVSSSTSSNSIMTSTQQQQQPPSGNRYTYRSNVYRADQQDLGWRVMGVFSACVIWIAKCFII